MAWQNAVISYLKCKDTINNSIHSRKYCLNFIKHDNTCDLGKWLYYSYDFYKNDEDFINLINIHKSYHDAAFNMVNCIKNDSFNNPNINETLLIYLQLSDQVLDALNILRKKYAEDV